MAQLLLARLDVAAGVSHERSSQYLPAAGPVAGGSGSQALQTADQLHPDIVLLDLMMPEMDGYEVARRIRKEPWGKDLLLVALSGWGHEEHRRRSKEAGFDQHVTKPADVMALQAVLNERRPAAQQTAAAAHALARCT